MKIDLIALEDSAWTETLARLAHDFYHRPAYVGLDARRMHAVAQAFRAEEGRQLFFIPYLVRPCEGIESTEVSSARDAISPYGYPGLLVSEAGRDPGFIAAAWRAFQHTLADHQVCSAFLRMHPILGADLPALFPPATFTDASETVAIDLHLDERGLWKQIRQGHQETIKKCQKLGYQARFVPFADVIDEFLIVYEETMDRVKAKEAYYFERGYFEELSRMPDVHCCVVEFGGKMVAACLFFEVGGIVQAHLGGTRTDYLAKSPFHLTLYQATLWAKARGNRWLHLGGGVGGSNDRLLHFKAGFSDHRFQFHTCRLITDPTLYRRLVDFKAQTLNTPVETLLASNFFPAYRA